MPECNSFHFRNIVEETTLFKSPAEETHVQYEVKRVIDEQKNLITMPIEKSAYSSPQDYLMKLKKCVLE